MAEFDRIDIKISADTGDAIKSIRELRDTLKSLNHIASDGAGIENMRQGLLGTYKILTGFSISTVGLLKQTSRAIDDFGQSLVGLGHANNENMRQGLLGTYKILTGFSLETTGLLKRTSASLDEFGQALVGLGHANNENMRQGLLGTYKILTGFSLEVTGLLKRTASALDEFGQALVGLGHANNENMRQGLLGTYKILTGFSLEVTGLLKRTTAELNDFSGSLANVGRTMSNASQVKAGVKGTNELASSVQNMGTAVNSISDGAVQRLARVRKALEKSGRSSTELFVSPSLTEKRRQYWAGGDNLSPEPSSGVVDTTVKTVYNASASIRDFNESVAKVGSTVKEQTETLKDTRNGIKADQGSNSVNQSLAKHKAREKRERDQILEDWYNEQSAVGDRPLSWHQARFEEGRKQRLEDWYNGKQVYPESKETPVVKEFDEEVKRVGASADQSAASLNKMRNSMPYVGTHVPTSDELDKAASLVGKRDPDTGERVSAQYIRDLSGAESGTAKVADNVERVQKAGSDSTTVKNTKELGKAAHASAGGFSKLWTMIKRIALIRTIRSVLQGITKSIGEGITNLYSWSKTMDGDGGKFAKSLDSMATSFLTLKNSIGAAVAPLIMSFIPVLNQVVSAVVKALDVINQLFAVLSGQNFWYKAVETATEFNKETTKASKTVKDLLADWDELNVIQSETSGSGSSSKDKDIGNFEVRELDDWAKKLKEWLSGFGELIENIKSWLGEHLDELIAALGILTAAILALKLSNFNWPSTPTTSPSTPTTSPTNNPTSPTTNPTSPVSSPTVTPTTNPFSGIDLSPLADLTNLLKDLDLADLLKQLLPLLGAGGLLSSLLGLLSSLLGGGGKKATVKTSKADIEELTKAIENLMDKVDELNDKFEDVPSMVKTAVDNSVSKINSSLASFGVALSNYKNAVTNIVLNPVLKNLDTFIENVKSRLSAFNPHLVSVLNLFRNNVQTMTNNMLSDVDKLILDVKSRLSSFNSHLTSVFGIYEKNASSACKNILSDVDDLIKDAKSRLSAFNSHFTSVLNLYRKNVQTLGKNVLSDVDDTLKDVKSRFSAFNQHLVSVLNLYRKNVQTMTKNILTDVDDLFKDVKSRLSAFNPHLMSVLNLYRNNVQTMTKNILTDVDTLFESIKLRLSTFNPHLTSVLSLYRKNVQTTTNDILTDIDVLIRDIKLRLSTFYQHFQSVMSMFKYAVDSTALNPILWGVDGAIVNIKGQISAFYQHFQSVMSMLKYAVDSMALNPILWGVDGAIVNIKGQISAFYQHFQSVLKMFEWSAQNSVSVIKDLIGQISTDITIRINFDISAIDGVLSIIDSLSTQISTDFGGGSSRGGGAGRTIDSNGIAPVISYDERTAGRVWYNPDGTPASAEQAAYYDELLNSKGIKSSGSGNTKTTAYRYATGSYNIPTGETFIAREAGPELVGTIGNHTAVANNVQIIEGISQGVAMANDREVSLLREQNALLRQILAKDMSVVLEPSAQLGRVNAKSARMYDQTTGRR